MIIEYAAAIYHLMGWGDRREPTMTIQENAGRLQMGTRKSIAPKLHDCRKSPE
jgi:hypothetical protein